MNGPKFETSFEDDADVLTVSGELDIAYAERFRSARAPLTGRVIVDLSATFLDSSSIGVMVAKQKRLRLDGVELVIRRPHELPAEVLKLTGLSDWIVN
jgi:anti-anti-sigma factor